MLLTIALVFFRVITNAVIASNTLEEEGDPAKDVAKKFVHLTFNVPEEDISASGVSAGRSKYEKSIYIVSVRGHPSYVFKTTTGMREIELAINLSSLENKPEDVIFVTVSHFASKKDLDQGRVFDITSMSDQKIKKLDRGERYYSLQPFVDAKRGVKVVEEIKKGKDLDIYKPLARKMGKAVSLHAFERHYPR
ncbi:MAG: hypothetical protein LBJ13_03020 [Puniceicoccales bacterium]|nr:hypothetical protein [Puniceicoccales bacterium]